MREPEHFLPLSRSALRILLALGRERMHGYAIMQAIQEKTDGQERILPGSLYAALARMSDDGLIEEAPAPEDDQSGGPERRYYRRTELGAAVCRAESLRLKVLVDVATEEGLIEA